MAELDLDTMRRWIADALKPVKQGSGATWEMMSRRDLAVVVANRLVAEIERLQAELDDEKVVLKEFMGRVLRAETERDALAAALDAYQSTHERETTDGHG